MKQGVSGVSAVSGVCPSASLTSRVCKAMWPQPQKIPACACSWLEASSVTPAGCTGTGWLLRANTPHRYWNGIEEIVLKSVTSRGCRSILRTLFCFVLIWFVFPILWFQEDILFVGKFSFCGKKIERILKNCYKTWIWQNENIKSDKGILLTIRRSSLGL